MSNELKSDIYNVLIIGAGKIAGQLDEVRRGQLPITHAGALNQHSGFFLLGCVEPNEARRSEFQKYWRIPHGFASLDEALASGDIYHLAVVCSPTHMHFEHLKALHKTSLKLVFAEKPLTSDILAAQFICNLYKNGQPKLGVNFNRRWNATFIRLANHIREGRYGSLITSYGIYTKGILNNGSHLIDLFDLLVGPLEAVRVTRVVNDWNDFEDPTLDAELRSRDGAPVHLIGGDARFYFIFELTLIFEKAAISIENGGCDMRIRPVKRCRTNPSQYSLGRSETQETQHDQQFILAVDNLYNFLKCDDPLRSTVANAIRIQQLASTLISLSKGRINNA